MLSCHRIQLDLFLCNSTKFLRGTVLDIGGKKTKRRGKFQVPRDLADAWLYTNIDGQSCPDFIADAHHLPVKDGSIESFVLCEVLELVHSPEIVVQEAGRILREGGFGIITMPFLYPVHDEPFDAQRWTLEKLTRVAKEAGLSVVHSEALGGPFTSIHNILYSILWRSKPGYLVKIFAIFLKLLTPAFLYIDRRFRGLWSHIPSGWGLVVHKDSQVAINQEE